MEILVIGFLFFWIGPLIAVLYDAYQTQTGYNEEWMPFVDGVSMGVMSKYDALKMLDEGVVDFVEQVTGARKGRRIYPRKRNY